MSHRPSPTLPPVAAPTTPLADVGAPDSLVWVSWLRVVAIAGVVAIHVAGLSAGAPDARSTAAGRLGIAMDFGSRWCVPVFVMLSGALLLDPARYRGAGDFLRRRALRLVPAVLVWHLVYLGFVVATAEHAGTSLTAQVLVQRVLTGRLYTALYFFWIVLGLAVLTPVLVPWVATASRRAQVVAGLMATAVPALAVLTVPARTDVLWKADMSWVETPWTWWVPYVGYYLLGQALRDVVLTGWRLLLAGLVAVGGSTLLIWQWDRPTGIGGVLERYVPAEAYYSPTVAAVAVAVFLLARALVRPDGALEVLCRRAPALAGRRLGDSTLGVFAVHLLVLQLVLALPLIGGGPAAGSALEVLMRWVTVFVVAYLVALLARRVPVVRRVF